MAPKMTETTRSIAKGVRGCVFAAALAGLLLTPGVSALAAPAGGEIAVAVMTQDEDSESRIVPRGSGTEEEPAAEAEYSNEDDIDWTNDGDEPGNDETDEVSDEDDRSFDDDEEQEAENETNESNHQRVRFSGISRPGANLDPSQWMGVFDGRLVEPFAVAPAPARLSIGEIGVDAVITTREIVNGEMQTPADEHEVTWYKETAKPGEDGNMVMSGHLNWYGVPEAVFYRINELEEGDQITVSGEDGVTHTYEVTWVKLVDIEHADLEELVGETRKASLTLITCGGQWEAELGQYGHRTVVRAELVS